jgi:hypothetical protein
LFARLARIESDALHPLHLVMVAGLNMVEFNASQRINLFRRVFSSTDFLTSPLPSATAYKKTRNEGKTGNMFRFLLFDKGFLSPARV